MFGSGGRVVFVAGGDAAAALRRVALPVLRAHGLDDALPELDPDDAAALPRFTLLRPGRAPAAELFRGDAPAGLVLTAERPLAAVDLSGDAPCVVLRLSRRPRRFPWHPGCRRIRRRCCSVSAAERREAAARGELRDDQQQRARAAAGGGLPARLLPLVLHDDDAFLADLGAAVLAADGPLPLLVTLEAARRAAAAVTIQAAWRAHAACRGVGERALRLRAARAIQAAWRAFLLRSRLAALSAAAAAYRHAMAHLRFSSLMCLDVAGRRLLDAAAARSPALWPERRLRFVVAPEDGQLLLLLDDGADGGGSPRRSGLPAWVGAGIPVVAAGRAAAQQGGELGIAQAGMLLTLGASVRDLLEPANVADGSGRDCQASAVDCQASADCQAAAVAQLVTFRDAQQAAQRAALLAVFTFDPRSRRHAQLTTVQESPLGAAYRSLTGLASTAPDAGAPQLRQRLPAAGGAAPLQPVRPTPTLTEAAAASSSDGTRRGVRGEAGLHFHVSLLSRLPHLAKELAAADEGAAQATATAPPPPAAPASQQALQAGDQPGRCAATTLPPPAHAAQADATASLGAAAAASEEQQRPKQRARQACDSDAEPDGRPACSVALRTGHCLAPNYEPASLATAAAAAQAVRREAAATAAAHAEQLRAQRQADKSLAAAQHARQQEAGAAAAQQQAMATKQALQQQRQAQQAAAASAAASARHARRAAPAARARKQRAAASFAAVCGRLGKTVAGRLVAATRQAAAQSKRGAVAGRRQAEAQAARRQAADARAAAQASAARQASASAAQLAAAAAAVADLEAAARRAAAAARRAHVEAMRCGRRRR